MIGIIIGVLSVILVLSIGEAAQRYILLQISAFGSDVLFIASGGEHDASQPTLFLKESIAMKDVKKLQSYPWVTMITGKLIQDDQATAGGITTNVQVVGTMPDEIRINDIKPASGSFFSMAAVDGMAREAVIGHDIADLLFGAEDPIGKTLKINDGTFRVIGVMEQVGTKAFQNVDKQVYTPITSALELYNKRYLTLITLKTSLNFADAKDRIRAVMRERHNIDNPEDDLTKDDFHIHTQEDLIRSAAQITDILQILLTSIAAISLLVGGIGIMNIMYVSVTERIREIGLRKSIGARRTDILGQFLLEAVIQTLLGGIIGTIFGIIFSAIAIRAINAFQPGWTFAVSKSGIFLGLVVSIAIGIVFGYFPARRAATMRPIEALRFE
jgi:putative ABC transport system permease protein